MKKKRLKPKRLLCYTITIVQPVLPLLTQNTLGRRTLVLSKESASSRKAMEMKLLGRVFSNCQLIHSESAKVLGLTYQLQNKSEMQPYFFKSAVPCNCLLSIFFSIPHQGNKIALTQHRGGLTQGPAMFCFSSCVHTLNQFPSFPRLLPLLLHFLVFCCWLFLGASSNLSINWL